MIDTKTVAGGRIMYIGSELGSTVTRITDPFGTPALVPVNQYAAGATILNGEIGKVDKVRIIVVPEILHSIRFTFRAFALLAHLSPGGIRTGAKFRTERTSPAAHPISLK